MLALLHCVVFFLHEMLVSSSFKCSTEGCLDAGGGAGWDWVELHDAIPARQGEALVDGCHPSAGMSHVISPTLPTWLRCVGVVQT